ncbi:MAG: ATP-dependent RNA helicase HrpA [Gammaproteobacteria bacterium]|nr:ATP-dependent RNA helicase HrpA [Gammaproteobacteria bacterium]
MGLSSLRFERAPVLPIMAHLGLLEHLLKRTPVTLVCGATGSGKSTQVPQLCLSLAHQPRIGHTQPRRLAARTVAQRIASERGERLGEIVGYQTRFEREAVSATRLKVMTDGILLQEISRDRELRSYDIVIVDEVHERSLNIDFLLGYLRTLLPRRPELRVILMSATFAVERFQAFFGNAAVLEIPGATHAIDMRYRPLTFEEDGSSDLNEAIVQSIKELDAEARGDILVFLPGEREIAEAAEAVNGARFQATEVLPLYARLSVAEQQKVFSPHQGRHIVLATNVAETSVTVPGIHHVIDSGLARLGSYSSRSKLQRLPVGAISQASAEQRKGRCGRERPGICVRLFSEEQFARRPPYTEPEIRRSNLAAVILRLADLKLGSLEDFPLVDSPTSPAIADGYQLLRELGALDHQRHLTPTGHQLARIPLDPRLAKMLASAAEFNCVREILVIVSALSAGDVRERPREARSFADIAHSQFRDHRSDFLWFLAAWTAVQQELLPLSRRQQQAYCRTQFWSWRRIREWLDLHRELSSRCHALGLRLSDTPASYRAIHQAVLAGVLSRIARWEEKTDYVGCRQQRVRLHPGSAVRTRPPKWIVAAEITETSATYARLVAKIDPSWAARAATHLAKRTYSEAQWDVERGEAYVLEEQALYGLTLIRNRRVALQDLDPARARAVLIAQGLVAGRLGTLPRFLRHNLELVDKVKAAEERARRRDLLADEGTLAAFYAAHLPIEITTRRQLAAWLRPDDSRNQQLQMSDEMVTRGGIAQVTDFLYPAVLNRRGMRLPLSYRFAPGEDDDGVTVAIPFAVAALFTSADFERLVPGLLSEKVTAMIKRLPKERRRYLAPLAEYAPALTAAIEHLPGSLAQALSAAVLRITGMRIGDDEWDSVNLPAHLQPSVRLLDQIGKECGRTRDLCAWLASAGAEPGVAFQTLPWGITQDVITSWTSGVVPETISLRIGGIEISGYPALQPASAGARWMVSHDPTEARRIHREGTRCLLLYSLQREVKLLGKEIGRMPLLKLQAQRFGVGPEFEQLLLTAAFGAAMTDLELPRDEATFVRIKAQVQATVFARLAEWMSELEMLFALASEITTLLPAIASGFPEVREDIDAQLRALFRYGLAHGQFSVLRHYPRYLRAVRQRLERLSENPRKDQFKHAQFAATRARADALDFSREPETAARLRYLLEEFRVSLFAPTLGTAEKVSARRIEEFLSRLGTSRERLEQ